MTSDPAGVFGSAAVIVPIYLLVTLVFVLAWAMLSPGGTR